MYGQTALVIDLKEKKFQQKFGKRALKKQTTNNLQKSAKNNMAFQFLDFEIIFYMNGMKLFIIGTK